MKKKNDKGKNFPENLKQIPNKNKRDIYYYVDYLELVTLFSKDKFLTKDSATDLFKDQMNLSDMNIDPEIEEDPNLNEFSDEDDIVIEENENDEGEIVSNTYEDESIIDIYFQNIEYRIKQYGDFYPIRILEKRISVVDNFSEKHLYYIFLLLSANLHYTGFYRPDLTADFEKVSLDAIKKYLPGGKYGIFGISGNLIAKGKIIKRIRELIKELGEKESPYLKDKIDYKRGDAGLDVYAYFPFEDKLGSKLIVFGQCACGDNWEKKQYESKIDRWGNFAKFLCDPINCIFIPLDFHNIDGGWHDPTYIENSILLDRKRILDLYINTSISEFNNLKSYSIINQILKEKVEFNYDEL
jgi:hypothetical protein